MIGQDITDKLLSMRAILRSLLSTMGGGGNKICQFLRRIVGLIRYPLSRIFGSGMGLYEIMLIEYLDEFFRAPHPDPFADITCRQRIIRPVKDHMMVGMNTTLLP